MEKKGYPSGRYKLFTVLFWVGGEIAGAFVGALLASGGEGGGLVYLLALVGAVIGAWLSRRMVNRLPPVPTLQTAVFD